jgi:prepilin-type N-terminal cleavage/methylation domain-containing protein
MLKLNKERGFTLIELVIVIAIIGILSAVAIPKFINLSTNAQAAATSAIAGALASANSNNYGSRKAVSTLGIAVSNCTDLSNALQGGIPSGYTITSGAVSADASVTCTLTGPNSTTATFIATGIS